MPGADIGTRNTLRPSCFRPVRDVRVSRKIHWATRAYEVQIFCPLMTHPSPSRSADVRTDARSDPASGSLNPWHQITSPRVIGGR